MFILPIVLLLRTYLPASFAACSTHCGIYRDPSYSLPRGKFFSRQKFSQSANLTVPSDHKSTDRAAKASLPGQRSEPFYNGDRNLTKSFGVNLAVGKYSLNLLQTVVPGSSGEQVRSH
jgi:hypothetical protein